MVKITSGIPVNNEENPDVVLVKSESGLTGTFTKVGNKIHAWCADNEIDADFVTKWYDSETGNADISAWYIADEEQRAFFTLIWGGKIVSAN